MKRKIKFAILLGVFAIFCLASVNVQAAGTPDSDAKYYNGHYYKVYDTSMTWKEAKVFCEKKGGHLATITSAGEQEFLKSLGCRRRYNYWLGATDEQTEGTWKWVTGEAWKYSYWASGEPTNQQQSTGISEDYLQLCVDWGMKWNDSTNQQDSTASVGLICEWEPVAMSKTSAALTKTSYSYNGKQWKPSVIVKFSGKTLKPGTDYTVSYKSNKWPGTACVTIKGKGYYTGTVKKYFTITPKQVSKVKVSQSGSKKLKITWTSQKSNKINGYQINYKKSTGSSKFQTKYVSANKKSYTLKNLASKTKYKIYIRSYVKSNGKIVYGKWSSVKTLKTK